MNIDIILGGGAALAAYLILCLLVLYNRKIVEKIHKKNITHVREIKHRVQKRGARNNK